MELTIKRLTECKSRRIVEFCETVRFAGCPKSRFWATIYLTALYIITRF